MLRVSAAVSVLVSSFATLADPAAINPGLQNKESEVTGLRGSCQRATASPSFGKVALGDG